MTTSDKHNLSAAAAVFLATGLLVTGLDAREAAPPAAADKPQVSSCVTVQEPMPAFDAAVIVAEALAHRSVPDWYREDVPLPLELQEVLYAACAGHGVPLELALGVMEVESGFRPDADNGHDYGLMQLNRSYFPDSLTPADNIRAGVAFLGALLAEYEDLTMAVMAYNVGPAGAERAWEKGVTSTCYTDAVLAAAERWSRIYTPGTKQ